MSRSLIGAATKASIALDPAETEATVVLERTESNQERGFDCRLTIPLDHPMWLDDRTREATNDGPKYPSPDQLVVLTLWVQRGTLIDMANVRESSSDRLGGASVEVAKRSPAVDNKGSINLRVETNTRQLIDDAAAVLGKTRTEFMLETARRRAIDVLLDQRLFTLDADRFDAFMHALDNPPAPGPKLRSLLRRVPAWRK